MDFLRGQLGDEPDAVIVLAAHNLKGFDHIYMTREFRRHLGADWQWPADWLYFDSLILARLMFRDQGNSQVRGGHTWLLTQALSCMLNICLCLLHPHLYLQNSPVLLRDSCLFGKLEPRFDGCIS